MRQAFLIVLAIFILCDAAYAGSEAVQKAWGYYLANDYIRAVDTLTASSKEKSLGEEGHYLMGLSFLKLNDSTQAWKSFNYLLENYPVSDFTQSALLGLGDSYFIVGQYSEAAKSYERLLSLFPNSEYAPLAYLRIGISQGEDGLRKESEEMLNKLIRLYPQSFEAGNAREYLKKRPALNSAPKPAVAVVAGQAQVYIPQDGIYSVQVGAFSRDLNAYTYAETLKNGGYDAYVEKKPQDNDILYAVKIGHFNTKQEAQDYADKLTDKGFTARVAQ